MSMLVLCHTWSDGYLRSRIRENSVALGILTNSATPQFMVDKAVAAKADRSFMMRILAFVLLSCIWLGLGVADSRQSLSGQPPNQPGKSDSKRNADLPKGIDKIVYGQFDKIAGLL